MKQKDVILVFVIVVISGTVSFFTSRLLFSSSDKLQQKVEVAEEISDEFPQHDTNFFNDRAINPTNNITIGDPNNPTP